MGTEHAALHTELRNIRGGLTSRAAKSPPPDKTTAPAPFRGDAESWPTWSSRFVNHVAGRFPPLEKIMEQAENKRDPYTPQELYRCTRTKKHSRG